MIEEDDESFSVLVRPLFKEMLKLLKTRLGRCKRIIMGPPGCGKSTSLYQIVQFGKLAKWIVFYLPDCVTLLFNENTIKANDACKHILLNLLQLNEEIFKEAKVANSKITFKQLIDKAIEEKNCEYCLLDLITELCTYDKGAKVLFAFDSWNKLLHMDNSPNAIVHKIAYWTSFRVRF
jgi:hypothetical protein